LTKNNPMEKKIKTYKQLLSALQKLTPAQLRQEPVILIDDEMYGNDVNCLSEIEDDIYRHKEDDEDCGTLEELEEKHGDEFNKKDYKISTRAGRIFLYSNNG